MSSPHVQNVPVAAASPTLGAVLLVDDDAVVLTAYERVLRSAGYAVTSTSSGYKALELLCAQEFAVVLSDISMPQMSGIALVEKMRAMNLHVPVVLMTGNGTLETAVSALEHSVVRYLLKPVDLNDLLAAVGLAAQQGVGGGRAAAKTVARAEASRHLDLAMASMWMAFQPILRRSDKGVSAYEALLRSRDTVLSSPLLLLHAAAQQNRLPELGARVRALVAQAIPQADPDASIYVNVDPLELESEDLFSPASPLSKHAHRVVLEITERASIEKIRNLAERIGALRALGYRVAVDDLGAGHSGLQALVQLRPEVVKIDMSLIRNVDREPLKRSIISAIVQHCHTHGLQVVAEGVETEEELTVVAALGCDLLQGYLFARPAEGFPPVSWSQRAT